MPILSDKANDIAMVKRYIEENGLDPVPIRTREPVAVRKGLSRLVMEHYSWGRVCFASDPGRSASQTWVEHQGRPETAAWSWELRKLTEQPAFVEALLPSETAKLDALRAMPGKRREEIEDEDGVGYRPIPMGSRTPRGKRRISPAVAKARKQPPRRVVTEKAKASIQLCYELVRAIASNLGWVFAESEGKVRPGQLFVRDSYCTSGYFNLFIRQRGYKNTWVGILRPRTVRVVGPAVNVQIFSGALDDVRLIVPDRLEVKVWSDKGHLCVVVKGMDTEAAPFVASAIASIISEGKLYGRI